MSDHAAVIANLMFINVKTLKNPTISRLDPRPLLDREGLQHLECRFRELADQALDEWNPHVRLEYYKMCIRTAANAISGRFLGKFSNISSYFGVEWPFWQIKS